MMIIGAAIAFLLVVVIMIYNNLIRKKNEVDNAFGGIDVQLKQRYDLIPNLVATVQEYASHEKDLLGNITALRAQATSGGLSPNEKVALDNQISKAMSGIMIAVENYPELKANENFLNLQRTMNELESQISAARRAFNATITDYNNAIQVFPNNIIAGAMNLKAKEVFEIPQAERENVNVKELFKR